ncbi:putative ABC transporter permease [Acetobacterium tundrae]|uniref:ABC transporter permease n=1 Tax=Acetobacterium tundrae TaxID=132932 RepID=A0ABR6WQB2_9FIRM|nr:putative ABC transporter permease [Acetobacterium tundrae]MBC3798340.1 hypothetical protein [Acetobacterium tundrae]
MYYALSLLFICFILYSFIGWVCEVVYCSILERKITNRGFLIGPYCPIYGVGALFIVMFLLPFTSDAPVVFLLGVVFTSILEYITSWGMEKLFHAKWWDYSNKKYNINGRVCLLNSFFFGIMSLALMYFIYPFVQGIITSFSSLWIQIIATVMAVFFLCDVVESTHETLVFNKKLVSIYDATIEFKDSLKDKGISTAHEFTAKIQELKDGTLADAIDSAQSKVQELKDSTLAETMDSAQNLVIYLVNRINETRKINRYAHKRIMKAFPGMSHHNFQSSLEIYKAILAKNKTKNNPDSNQKSVKK